MIARINGFMALNACLHTMIACWSGQRKTIVTHYYISVLYKIDVMIHLGIYPHRLVHMFLHSSIFESINITIMIYRIP